MTKKTTKKRTFVQTVSIKTIKSTLQDMRRDGIVKVPPYSHLCKKCLVRLWQRLEKQEGAILSKMDKENA